jgi:hypothetical protein
MNLWGYEILGKILVTRSSILDKTIKLRILERTNGSTG